ncbi:MAG: hypothetical protein WCO45_01230 [Pseudanabaena sp. ELA607]|jgi:hypothetical protein
MQSDQLSRLHTVLSSPQIQLFQSLNKHKQWLGELYLTLILSQEDLDYIYNPPVITHNSDPIYLDDSDDNSCITLVCTNDMVEVKNYAIEYQSTEQNHHDFYLKSDLESDLHFKYETVRLCN